MNQRRVLLALFCATIGNSGCKLNSNAITQGQSDLSTSKAKIDTLLIGGDFQACVATAPLQLFYKTATSEPKYKLGNISASDAGYDFIDIAYQPGKSAEELFADNQKLYAINESGKKIACPLTSAYIAKADWTPVAKAANITSTQKAEENKTTDTQTNIGPSIVTEPNEIFAKFSKESYFKLSGNIQAADLSDKEKCYVFEGEMVRGILKVINERKEHLFIEITKDFAHADTYPLCKKGSKGYIYVAHLKGNPIALNPTKEVTFKKTASTTTETCTFKGTLYANLVDYANYENVPYFKIELTSALPNVVSEKDFCKKGSIGYVAINDFAKEK